MLTDEQIQRHVDAHQYYLYDSTDGGCIYGVDHRDMIPFARAIEAAIRGTT